jgi:predicted AlkP superfamily phosphohydrolase/phosphomutase
VIEIQEQKVLLKEGQWSEWLSLDFEMSMPGPNKHISGICRFYLQELSPNLRLYVTPINSDPSDSYLSITEPPEFIEEISDRLGLFYTTGFQEDHKALSNKVFTEAEFAFQSGIVLEERLNLLNYALENYDDGLLFFYFSSTDLQAHMFWWDSEDTHPARSAAEAKEYFGHLQNIYRKMDSVVGDIIRRYGKEATIIVLSDHGFANFKRQFNLNTWLKENGYIKPADCRSLLSDVIWSGTKAYGLGMNGLYLNLRGRERDGIVEPSREREELLEELILKLEAVTDTNGKRVIRKVHRTDVAYRGPATRLAPDLIVGYARGYRVAWSSILGDMNAQALLDNDAAWGADHCADVSEVPGVIFSNKPITAEAPALIDLAPTILTEFGLKIPSSMEGEDIFTA